VDVGSIFLSRHPLHQFAKSTLLTLPILNLTMENCLLDKKLTLHLHHIHFAKWPSPNPHHQLAKSPSPHCQVTKFTLPGHQVHIAKSPSSHCQVTKSTLPSHQVHIAMSPSPHCQVTKSTLPSHQVHIAKSSPPYWEQFESLNHEFYFFLVSYLNEWCGEIDSPSAFFFWKLIFDHEQSMFMDEIDFDGWN
jgi:hypothetical protein